MSEEITKAEKAVLLAAQRKYRSLVYTSGVDREFADAELIKAVEAYYAAGGQIG